MPGTTLRAAEVNLSDEAFWLRPRSERDASFEALRREAPVSWQPAPEPWAPSGDRPPRGYWAVTTYEGVRTVSRDPETYCSGGGVMLFDNLSPAEQYLNDGWVGLDAPRHTKLRRLVSGAFTPRTMRRIEDFVAAEAAACIEALAERGECDFFADLAAPLPITVICEMLGVPQPERAEVVRLTHEGVHFEAGVPFEDTLRAVEAVIEYAKELAARRRRQPGDDLVSSLVRQEVDGQRLSDDDVAATFWVIITGGSDTTSTTAAHAMIAFSEFPDERRRLQEHFGELAAPAVEEMLRWATPVLDFRRTATRDTELLGQPIAAGDNVMIFYQSANRDGAVFAEPFRFDVGRDPNPHLSFGGGGPHFCLGAALARLELRTLFSELFARLPDIELAGEPTYVPGPFLDSVASVPCQFTPRWAADDF